MNDEVNRLLDDARKYAKEFLKTLPTRPVHAIATAEQLQKSFDVPLTEDGEDAAKVLAELVAAADPGLLGTAGPRFFGFVIGGSHPIALATDWMVSAWDQNNGLFAAAPALSVVEEIARRWTLDVLHLPKDASIGFVTGGQAANTTCLAAGRHAVLRKAGWNVETDGLQGAPRITVIATEETHATIYSALRLLGVGIGHIVKVPTDRNGAMRTDLSREALAKHDGPIIVCAQAGNVNTGAFDPIDEIVDAAHEKNAWVHVDGAFGLWARASKKYAHLARGVERADSWATDAHKWLNVPYDCGIAIVGNSAAHRAAMTVAAAYLVQTEGAERDPLDWVPEFSRRARATPVYTTLRQLGRGGVEALVDRCCAHAAQFAETLRQEPGVEVLTDVVLNQVLVRFTADGRDADELTRAVVKRVQDDGILWLSGTNWKSMAAMRISVSNWMTSEEDVRVSSEAILSAYRTVMAG